MTREEQIEIIASRDIYKILGDVLPTPNDNTYCHIVYLRCCRYVTEVEFAKHFGISHILFDIPEYSSHGLVVEVLKKWGYDVEELTAFSLGLKIPYRKYIHLL